MDTGAGDAGVRANTTRLGRAGRARYLLLLLLLLLLLAIFCSCCVSPARFGGDSTKQ